MLSIGTSPLRTVLLCVAHLLEILMLKFMFVITVMLLTCFGIWISFYDNIDIMVLIKCANDAKYPKLPLALATQMYMAPKKCKGSRLCAHRHNAVQ